MTKETVLKYLKELIEEDRKSRLEGKDSDDIRPLLVGTIMFLAEHLEKDLKNNEHKN